jgi:hypothetical protein
MMEGDTMEGMKGVGGQCEARNANAGGRCQRQAEREIDCRRVCDQHTNWAQERGMRFNQND